MNFFAKLICRRETLHARLLPFFKDVAAKQPNYLKNLVVLNRLKLKQNMAQELLNNLWIGS